MAKFFIDRPIFAWVIALFIIVMGGVAITQLPISQYPPVAPPAIVVTADLPGRLGADAGGQRDRRHRAGDERLARPHLHGVGRAGRRHRHDHDHLRDRHQPRPRAGGRAEPPVARRAAPAGRGDAAGRARRQVAHQLPAVHDPVVGQPGLSIRSRWATMRRATCCPKSSASPASARRSCSAPSARCASGSTRPSWSASTCRRPMSTRRSGRRTRRSPRALIGDLPNVTGQAIAATVVVNGQLTTVEQFGNIVLRANPDGSAVRLKDVARIELGGQAYAHLRAPERPARRRHRRPAGAERQRAGDGQGDPRQDGGAASATSRRA